MNVRIVTFVLVALTIIGLPTYWFLDEYFSGGIKDRGTYVDVNLKTMSNFDLDQTNGKTEDVPAKWRALDGRKVRLQGEMWLGDNAQSAGETVPTFELVYSIAKCCFNGVPQKQHFVLGKINPGKGVTYEPGYVNVTGTLHVRVEHENGAVKRVYSLDVDSVDPV